MLFDQTLRYGVWTFFVMRFGCSQPAIQTISTDRPVLAGFRFSIVSPETVRDRHDHHASDNTYCIVIMAQRGYAFWSETMMMMEAILLLLLLLRGKSRIKRRQQFFPPPSCTGRRGCVLITSS
jgi:hypothetical protein